MKTNRHIILIPVYNDWNSLSKLLIEINKTLKKLKYFKNQILIIDDCSSEKINLIKTKFSKFEKITVLKLKKNLGSQKSIAIGLSYVESLKKQFFVTVMDGDGEDQPVEILKMINLAKKYENFVITSNRKKRKESFIIRFLYKLHLLITFFFTFKWISFGNFTSFHSRNIKKIIFKNQSWLAHSSSVVKNCLIKRTYAKRGKRYFDNSHLKLYDLLEHSIRINSLFINKIFLNSILYILIINFVLKTFLPKIFFASLIIFFNLILLVIKKKHQTSYPINYKEMIKSIKSI